jgi:hypothetical protein
MFPTPHHYTKMKPVVAQPYRRLYHLNWVGVHHLHVDPVSKEDCKQQSSQLDEQGSSPPSYTMLAYVGMGLAFVGTLVAYASYALAGYGYINHIGYWPSVTSMLGDWPLVGGVTLGAGVCIISSSVIMGASMFAQQWPEAAGAARYVVYSSAAAIVSIWGVVGSANTYGMAIIDTLHGIFTLAFLVFSAYAYVCAAGLLSSFLGPASAASFKGRHWIRGWTAAVLFFSFAAVVCGLALWLTRDEHAFFGRRGWNQAFAIAELCLLVSYTGAYVSLISAVGKASSAMKQQQQLQQNSGC